MTINDIKKALDDLAEEKDKEIEKLNKEIERLNTALNGSNNIITELEKWLKEQLHYHKGVYFAYNGCDDLCEALNKLKELKENK